MFEYELPKANEAVANILKHLIQETQRFLCISPKIIPLKACDDVAFIRNNFQIANISGELNPLQMYSQHQHTKY